MLGCSISTVRAVDKDDATMHNRGFRFRRMVTDVVRFVCAGRSIRGRGPSLLAFKKPKYNVLKSVHDLP